MTILMSYFASPVPKERKVCIAKKPPRGFGGLHILQLAPSHPWAKNWQASYLANLQDRFPGGSGLPELLDEIESQVFKPVLCCYEKNPLECHRNILADYVFAETGLYLKEWCV